MAELYDSTELAGPQQHQKDSELPGHLPGGEESPPPYASFHFP